MQDIQQRIYDLKHQTLDFDHTLELGKLYLEMGDKLEARHYFKQCIENFPTEAEGYHALGKFLLKEEKINEANNYISKALDISPKSVDILISLSSLHLAIHGFERAKTILVKAHKLEPTNPLVNYFQGKLAYLQNDLFHARKSYEAALEIADDRAKPKIFYGIAVIDTQQGYYKKALDHFEQCKRGKEFSIENKENYYKLYHNIGYCHLRLGNYGIAQDMYLKLISRELPITEDSYINLAETYWIQEDLVNAHKFFEKANRLQRKAWPYMRELDTYSKEGESWLAREYAAIPKEQSPGPNLAMYLGCVIPNRYPYIDVASRHVLSSLGVGLVDMEGADAPAPGVFRSFDIETWLTLGARNITIAEEVERNLCIMCNGCYGTLNDINTELQAHPEKKELVNQNLKEAGVEFKGTVDAEHIVWVLYNDIGMDRIKAKLKIPLKYKVAVHYGCHILKPIHNKPWKDSFETPTFFDDLVEMTGCKSIPHRDKLMCCGAGGGLRGSEKEISLDFTKDKLEAYREAGIDIIVTCCPFCHLQLDLGQKEINGAFKDSITAPFKFPVIYITQLLGLAMGIDPYRLGLQKHPQPKKTPPFTPVDPIFMSFFDEL